MNSNKVSRVLEAMGNINGFLRFFGFNRINQSGGVFFVQNIKVRSAIITLVLLSVDVFSAAQRIGQFKNHLVNIFEALSSLIIWTRLVTVMFSLNRAKPKEVWYQYSLIADMDKALEINTVTAYTRDKFNANMIFFLILIIRMLMGTIDVTVWTVVLEFKNWPWYSKQISNQILIFFPALYAVKITVLKYRASSMERLIADFKEKLNDDVTIITETEHERQTLRFKQCYLRMHKYCEDINVTEGLQLMLYCCNLVLKSVNIIYSLTLLQRINEETSSRILRTLGFTSIGIFITDACLLVGLIASSRAIQNIFAEINAKVENIVEHNISVRPRSHKLWKEFAELIDRNPIEFTGHDFFQLDYSLLVTMLASIITYAVILIQFD